MAKSLRASGKQANRNKLREKVFAPIENARTERLSARLMELAQQAKPENPEQKERAAAMELDTPVNEKVDDANRSGPIESTPMEVDTPEVSDQKSRRSSQQSGRINKKKSKKSSASILFPEHRRKREKKAQAKKK